MTAQLSLFPNVAPEVTAPAALREPVAPEVCWSGVTRAGVPSTGVLVAGQSIEGFAKARFRGRWRSLEISIAGIVVAAITPDVDRPARRTLWIEGDRS